MTNASPLILHRTPGAGFDQPFEMLEACHERVQRMLSLLERLRQHLQAHGADGQAADAARDVMRYFDLAGPAHHDDEERHILPLLRANNRAALAERLHADHRRMAEEWAALREALVEVVAGRWSPALAAAAAERWPAYAALYAEHIRAEEDEAYPQAAAALDPAARQAMGTEMARRRGLGA